MKLSTACFGKHPLSTYTCAASLMGVLATSIYAQDDSSKAGSEEILKIEASVIVGEKQERTLLETPSSVEITNEKQLQERAIYDLKQLVKRTPGVVELGENRGLSIRGVQLFGATGTGQRHSSTINIVRDGVSLPRFDQRISPFEMWDVQQVEIYKGGQTTNLGRSSLAGAVVIKSNEPTFYTEGAFEGRLGSDGLYGTYGMLNTPIGDTFAVRYAGGYQQDDGQIFNPTLGIDADEAASQFHRGSFVFEPSDSLRSLTVISYNEADTGEDSVNVDTSNPSSAVQVDPFSRQIFSNLPGREDVTNFAISETIDAKLSDTFSLQAILTYSDSTYDRIDDADRTAGGNDASLFRTEDTEQFTGEIRLKYESHDKFKAHLGLYGSLQDIDEVFGSSGFDLSGFGIPALLDLNSDIVSDVTNYAIFGAATYDFNERWSATVGFRVDHQNHELSEERDSNIDFVIASGDGRDETDLTVFLPSASLTYNFTESSNISLLYKEDYRTGGVEIDLGGFGGTPGTINTFDPEYTRTLELAYRAENIYGASITANLYYTWWNDQQIPIGDPATPQVTITENAGKSTQYGVELAVDYLLTERTNVYFSGALMKTEFDEFLDPVNATDFSGNEFPGAPGASASFGITQEFLEGLVADVNFNYQDESFIDVQNSPGSVNDSFFLTNASIRYTRENWYLGSYVNNLFGEEYRSWNAAGNNIQVGDDTAYGVYAGMRF